MNEHDHRKLLEQIQREIEQTEPEDERGRELLRHLQADIHAFLELPESTRKRREPDDSFVERLNDAVDHFQITHPRLTMMLSQMSNILSNAGI